MATFIFKNGHLSVGGVDLSDWASQTTVTGEAETQDDTAMGDDWRSMKKGLKSFSLNVTFHQDHAASAVDDTLWAAFSGDSETAIVVRPDAGSVSATNPQYSGNVNVTQFTPINGNVGDLAQMTLTWPGTGALARATS